MTEFHYGDPKLDNQKCACGHRFNVHNQFNCTFAFEKEHECHCPLGRDTIEARYWAKRECLRAVKAEQERDEAKRVLNRKDVQYYLGWWNANRND
jgi:hypothetical protein